MDEVVALRVGFPRSVALRDVKMRVLPIVLRLDEIRAQVDTTKILRILERLVWPVSNVFNYEATTLVGS